MDYNFWSKIDTNRKRKWLIKKGYESAIEGSDEFIDQLFDLYKPAWFEEVKKMKKQVKKNKTKYSGVSGKEWKMWNNTNKPSHLGGARDRSRNYI